MLESVTLAPIARGPSALAAFDVEKTFPTGSDFYRVYQVASGSGASYLALAARWPLQEAIAAVASQAMVVDGGEERGLHFALLSTFDAATLIDVAATLARHRPSGIDLQTALSYGMAGEDVARSLLTDISPLLVSGELDAHAVLPQTLEVTSVAPFVLQPLRPASGEVPPLYCAPEGSAEKGAAYWAFGAVVVQALTGQRPAEGSPAGAWQSLLSAVPSTWEPLCRGLLNTNPQFRWGGEQVARWCKHVGDALVQSIPSAEPEEHAKDAPPAAAAPAPGAVRDPSAPMRVPSVAAPTQPVAIPCGVEAGFSPWSTTTEITSVVLPGKPKTVQLSPSEGASRRPAVRQPAPHRSPASESGPITYDGEEFESFGALFARFAYANPDDLAQDAFIAWVRDDCEQDEAAAVFQMLAENAHLPAEVRSLLLQMHFPSDSLAEWDGVPLEPKALVSQLDSEKITQDGRLPGLATLRALTKIFASGIMDHPLAPDAYRFPQFVQQWQQAVIEFDQALQPPGPPDLNKLRQGWSRPEKAHAFSPDQATSYAILPDGRVVVGPEGYEVVARQAQVWQDELAALCLVSWDQDLRRALLKRVAGALTDGRLLKTSWVAGLWQDGQPAMGALWVLTLCSLRTVNKEAASGQTAMPSSTHQIVEEPVQAAENRQQIRVEDVQDPKDEDFSAFEKKWNGWRKFLPPIYVCVWTYFWWLAFIGFGFYSWGYQVLTDAQSGGGIRFLAFGVIALGAWLGPSYLFLTLSGRHGKRVGISFWDDDIIQKENEIERAIGSNDVNWMSMAGLLLLALLILLGVVLISAAFFGYTYYDLLKIVLFPARTFPMRWGSLVSPTGGLRYALSAAAFWGILAFLCNGFAAKRVLIVLRHPALREKRTLKAVWKSIIFLNVVLFLALFFSAGVDLHFKS